MSGMAGGQMQTHLRHQLSDPPADLDQTDPEGVQLHPNRSTPEELPSQSVHQPVGRGMQQEPELVGYEPMATQAIRLHVHLEVLYPVLCFSSAGVELVKLLGSVLPRANHETPVGPLLHGFGLVDDPALTLPACRPVAILTEEPHLLSRPLVLLLGFF